MHHCEMRIFVHFNRIYGRSHRSHLSPVQQRHVFLLLCAAPTHWTCINVFPPVSKTNSQSCCRGRIWMSEIRPQRKTQHNGHWITNASLFFKLLFLDVLCRQGKEKRTLIKNSSHWRYETRFIHSSPAQNCKDWQRSDLPHLLIFLNEQVVRSLLQPLH